MLVALGVSGGIAAYKASEIIRGLDRAGASVQVIMTRNGARFITPLTLQTLSRNPVLSDLFELEREGRIPHIELARRISALVVAPATADILAKFARGIADDLLSTFYLAVTAPVLVAPSMNSRMLLHPSTQANLQRLAASGVSIIEPDSGWLAEGEHGPGRLPAPERIVELTLAAARRTHQLRNKSVLITAGPTREPLDPVRFLSNRSSGKMGFALAAAAARRGAKVRLISGPVKLATPFGVERENVETASQMREAILRHREGVEALFMAAAVADYVPRRATAKLKKNGSGLALQLEEGPDILAQLGANRSERLLIGFAAETESLLDNAREKLQRKNLDYIVANDVSAPGIGFDSDRNEVSIIGRDGEISHVPENSKALVAEAILDRIFGAAGDEGAHE